MSSPCMRRCLCNAKPRKFDLSNKLIMGNMADLVVRELWGAYEHQHKQRVMQLIRVVGCYSEPLLFVEVSQTQPWMVLHLNEAAVTVTGEQGHSIPRRASWQTCTCHLLMGRDWQAHWTADLPAGSPFI